MDHPLYTPDPRDASVIFLRHDTLRMCEWPDLLMLPGEDGREHGKCGCVDAGGDGYDGPALDNYSRSCGWCCPVGSHLFAATVQEVVREYGPIHTFVYFKNAQDTFFNCGEFDIAKALLRDLPVATIFMGFQLQVSQLRKRTRGSGSQGVNLLVPLLPRHEALPEPDDERARCRPRKYLASFSGQLGYSPIREKVFQLNGSHPLFHVFRSDAFGGEDPEGYHAVLRNSVFGLVPRGDEHYTFRLTEVLAAGAVPVLIDDDFVAPYGLDGLEGWAVRLWEDKVHEAPGILSRIDNASICAMKEMGTQIWGYARDVRATIDGMMEGVRTVLPAARLAAATSTSTSTTLASSTLEVSRTSPTRRPEVSRSRGPVVIAANSSGSAGGGGDATTELLERYHASWLRGSWSSLTVYLLVSSSVWLLLVGCSSAVIFALKAWVAVPSLPGAGGRLDAWKANRYRELARSESPPGAQQSQWAAAASRPRDQTPAIHGPALGGRIAVGCHRAAAAAGRGALALAVNALATGRQQSL